MTLITFSGPDRAGITAEVLRLLTFCPTLELKDLSQAIVGQHLTLSVLIESPEKTVLDLKANFQTSDLLKAYKIEITPYHASDRLSPRNNQGTSQNFVLTVIAEPIQSHSLSAATRALAESDLTITHIRRLSSKDFKCVEMQLQTTNRVLSGEDIRNLRQKLLQISHRHRVDLALQEETLLRRSKRLVVFDMDSTLIQNEVIDELAREAGRYEQVASITHSAMSGNLPFEESLRLRCAELKGLSSEALEAVYQRVTLTPGAEALVKTLKRLGYRIAILSGGFTFVAERLRDRLGLDFAYANTLEIVNQKLTGKVTGPIVHAQRKADLLETIAQQERILLEQVIAIGDGANDLLMLEKAGLGIAFNAKPGVREKADTALNHRDLRNVLYFLGHSSDEIAHLDDQIS